MTNITTKAESNWTYSEACTVMDELRAIGVECGVCVGGIWLLFNLEQHGVSVVEIIKRHKGAFCKQTMMEMLGIEHAQQEIRQRTIDLLEKIWNEGDRT